MCRASAGPAGPTGESVCNDLSNELFLFSWTWSGRPLICLACYPNRPAQSKCLVKASKLERLAQGEGGMAGLLIIKSAATQHSNALPRAKPFAAVSCVLSV